MCFSAEASLTAALFLGATGGTTLKNSSSRPQFFLAAIPLLFALQQLSEGIVWLHLSYNIGFASLFLNAQRSFLFFAFLVWPVWIPLSMLMLEQVPRRRNLLKINLVCGILLSLVNFMYGLQQTSTVHIVNQSLQYSGHVPSQSLIYAIIVLLPCFISSLKNLWIFGLLVAIAYVISDYFYTENFTSVWCFFAAVVSLSIYKILKDNQTIQEKTPKLGS